MSEFLLPAAREVHGGGLQAAALEYGIPVAEWMDLSTGINPVSWPVPELPAVAWQRLPEVDGKLERAAAHYYAADDYKDTPAVSPLAVAGSQMAIETLPQLRLQSAGCGTIAIPKVAYREHAWCWQRWGFEVFWYESSGEVGEAIARGIVDVVLVVNPNNPSGAVLDRDCLLQWRQMLADRQGWLVVDEAFMDMTPAASLVSEGPLAGLFVLRSLGKFFGLAGVRLGFVFAERSWLQLLEQFLPPWSVSHPARMIGQQALQDVVWQQAMLAQLALHSGRLTELLTPALSDHGMAALGGCHLFQTYCGAEATCLQLLEQLAQQGIWVRYWPVADQPLHLLRFGLPDWRDEVSWQRLRLAL